MHFDYWLAVFGANCQEVFFLVLSALKTQSDLIQERSVHPSSSRVFPYTPPFFMIEHFTSLHRLPPRPQNIGLKKTAFLYKSQ